MPILQLNIFVFYPSRRVDHNVPNSTDNICTLDMTITWSGVDLWRVDFFSGGGGGGGVTSYI